MAHTRIRVVLDDKVPMAKFEFLPVKYVDPLLKALAILNPIWFRKDANRPVLSAQLLDQFGRS